jgi:hemolysin activation/secretion protein/AraC-like DNA-binding protein
MTVERHLILQELTLPPSAEWSPRSQGWVVAHVVEGMGYWLQQGSAARQISVGDGFIAARNPNGLLRASQLGTLKLQFFAIQPQHLDGLLAVGEWHQLETSLNNLSPYFSIFTAGEPLGQKFTRIANQSRSDNLPMRCALLQLWVDAVAALLSVPASVSVNDNNKLHARFRQLVGQMTEAEFAECSLADLAKQLHCSERHFSRLFRKEFGVPLRAHQIELRLQHARRLLADANAKIINVAYESGYRHLGLFNAMFKRRFGATPSEWRQQNTRKQLPAQSRIFFSKSTSVVNLLLVMLGLFFSSPIFAQTNLTSTTEDTSTNTDPKFVVNRYLVSGNSILPPETIGGIFTNVPGAFGTNATADGICTVLNDLQTAYRERGYTTVSVDLPEQAFTNATVNIQVTEGKLASNQAFNSEDVIRALGKVKTIGVEPSLKSDANQTSGVGETIARTRTDSLQRAAGLDARGNKAKMQVAVVSTNAGPRFRVDKYLILGDSVLSPVTIGGIFTNVPAAFGTNVSFDGVRAALGDLQMAYRERGYVTVSVGLPKQKLTNNMVKVQVTEGRLAAINVTGNHYFSSNNVMRSLPSLHTNILLNSHIFQRELDSANASRDRQIYPVIGPGPEPGTSELTLKVKDGFPLHARLEVNNEATPGTPDMRVNASAQYDNLWDLEHQVGLQYSFNVEGQKVADNFSVSPLDEPLIANYSAYYRLPLGGYSSVQQQVDDNPSSFGYSEVTHQFRLPPANDRPTLTFYASRSTSDTGIKLQPATPETADTNDVVNGVVNTFTNVQSFTITNQNSGDIVTLNENLGLRLSLPLPELHGIRSTLTAGLDYKEYQSVNYQTNTSFITVSFVTDPSTGLINVQQVPVPQAQPPVFTKLDYLPFNIGWNGSVPDKLGATFFNVGANFNPLRVLSRDNDFARAAYTTNARANYVTVQMGASREQKVYKDWTMLIHADGQWANGALFSNEQYAMGGSGGVRGYTDGEAYGDTGWRVTIEPRTPEIDIGMVDGNKPFWIRNSVFMDYGEIYLLEPSSTSKNRQQFWGVGWGMTANIGNHWDARLTIAFPLIATAQTSAGDFHIYFGVGAQF